MKKDRLLVLVSSIVMELVGIFMIAKATASDSSPTVGIVLMVIGLFILIIGITKKGHTGKTDQP